jgi:hypothetical protein
MQAHWGDNRLGKALMAARERLRRGDKETAASSDEGQKTDNVESQKTRV